MSMFTHAMFLETMENLQRNLHKNSKDHGFWEGEVNQNIPTKLMLIVSELAEAMEEHRSHSKLGHKLSEVYYKDKDGGFWPEQVRNRENNMQAKYKPEGFAIELADAVIRIMDLCEFLGINLADAIMIKADYNSGREMMHGGKAY